jgi:hypothetical protein
MVRRQGQRKVLQRRSAPAEQVPAGQNHNAKLWDDERNATTVAIARMVEPFGFTGVEYIDLYPTLKRGDQLVEIPY